MTGTLIGRAVIGLDGPRLNDAERRWLRASPPLGVILFARNVESPAQVRSLIEDARQTAGRALWAVVDEEGGRVWRMPWPPFDTRPPAAAYGVRFRRDPEAAVQAVFEDARRTGEALAELGFTHDCAPVLDVFHPDGDRVIGDRAFAADPGAVARLAAACMRGLHAVGVAAVGKHFPGHGRADADSHHAVPHVAADKEAILAEAGPFAALIGQGLSHVMTAHVVYDAFDDQVATCSAHWIGGMLRGRFGFSGKVWSDDLCMKGVLDLAGGDAARAARMARAAGCDVLLVCQPEGVRRLYDVEGVTG
ncbi:MAG: beta-N-acetylhexosaminidase [Mariprofundaceae bacterium]